MTSACAAHSIQTAAQITEQARGTVKKRTEGQLLVHIWFKKKMFPPQSPITTEDPNVQLCACKAWKRNGDLAGTVRYEHICMPTRPDRGIVFLADNPVSMETSNYLTQRNTSTARSNTLTQSELGALTFMWLLDNCTRHVSNLCSL